MECWKTVAIRPRQAAMSPSEGAGRAVEAHLARVRRVEAAQDRDQRGLARAVAADQAEAAAGLQAQVHAAQRAGAAEPLVDPRRLGRGATPWSEAAGIAGSLIYSGRRGAADAAVGGAVDVAPQRRRR